LSAALRENRIATPHIGGLTPSALESQSRETVRQVKAIITDDVPRGTVNADHWRRRVAKPPG
jgi:D-3-phosphoglycerate dehydrogenase